MNEGLEEMRILDRDYKNDGNVLPKCTSRIDYHEEERANANIIKVEMIDAADDERGSGVEVLQLL